MVFRLVNVWTHACQCPTAYWTSRAGFRSGAFVKRRKKKKKNNFFLTELKNCQQFFPEIHIKWYLIKRNCQANFTIKLGRMQVAPRKTLIVLLRVKNLFSIEWLKPKWSWQKEAIKRRWEKTWRRETKRGKTRAAKHSAGSACQQIIVSPFACKWMATLQEFLANHQLAMQSEVLKVLLTLQETRYVESCILRNTEIFSFFPPSELSP